MSVNPLVAWPRSVEEENEQRIAELRHRIARREERREAFWAFALLIAAILLAVFAAPAHAQAPASKPALQIFADTAGISEFVTLEDSAGVKVPTAHPGVYITWVQARATATSLPSSAVLVAWDCEKHLVKRLAQIVYRLRPDSLGVMGAPEMVDRPWQAITDPGLAALVCRVGPTHAPALVHPTVPEPAPDPSFLPPTVRS